MFFKTVVMALAVGASAQTTVAKKKKKANIPPHSPDVQQSVLLALAQAIPTESVSYALASTSAFAAEMASSLSAGNTPAWYQALPSDVKSLLPQIYPHVEATPTPSSEAAASSSVYAAASSSAKSTVVMPYPTGAANSTGASTTMMGGTGSVGAPPSSTAAADSSAASATATDVPPFTGAASKIVGAGAVAVLGFLGVLVL
ncbi:hypothetical protein BDW02DRAFT_569907 [Decorospora gaudefroyi]|uniref:Uncharacterized protein n=1 Tax=Decorospora gaudefroyi TaxID=184978 RepID=A0A6A5KGI0_9PLEO|nr:hypothetical protein BDW02DRAFT_569907 [Decorospora gaudefroyi]